MVELTVGNEGEDESNSKNKYDDAVAKDEIVNQFKDGIDKSDRIARKNPASVGAEPVKIDENSDCIDKIISDMHENYACFYDAIIEQIPNKLKRGYYKVLQKLGMFNPDNAINAVIYKLGKNHAKIAYEYEKYEVKIKDTEEKIKELGDLQKKMQTLDAEMKNMQESQDSCDAWLLERDIQRANKQFNDVYNDMEHKQANLKQYDSMLTALDAMKKHNKFLIDAYSQMLSKNKTDWDMMLLKTSKEIGKLGEAYGKI